MKKVMAMVMIVVLVGLAVGCSQTSGSSKQSGDVVKERKWKIGHVRPTETSTHTDVVMFSDEIAEESAGKIEIEVYPSSQLGNYPVVQERIGIGDIEMQLAPVGTSVDKTLGLASAPYLVSTWDDARELYDMDSKLMKTIAERFSKQGIKLLAPYPKYFGGIALATEPNTSVGVIEDKGIKIRVPNMKSYEKTAQALGYIATPIAYSEAFTSIQTGIVDGAIGSGAEGYYSSFRDVVSYYMPVKDHFEMWFLYMSEEVWNDLSAKEKEIVQSAATKLEEGRWDRAEKAEQEYIDKLKAEGIEVIEYTAEDYEKMTEKVRKEVWPVIKKDYGADLFDEITKDLK